MLVALSWETYWVRVFHRPHPIPNLCSVCEVGTVELPAEDVCIQWALTRCAINVDSLAHVGLAMSSNQDAWELPGTLPAVSSGQRTPWDGGQDGVMPIEPSKPSSGCPVGLVLVATQWGVAYPRSPVKI